MLVTTTAFAGASGSGAIGAAPLPSEQRQQIVHRVIESWRESQRADGFLPYGFDFLTDSATDEPTAGGYMIREAGAFWAWARYYRTTRDERHREPLQRGIAALAQRSLPIGKSLPQTWLEQTRILSVPAGRLTLKTGLRKLNLLYSLEGSGKVVSADGQYESAWTGTTALALLAELAYWQASGDERFAAFRSAWRDGLLALRIPGAGFRESPTSIDDSDYFNGEAWLALAVYADLFRNDATLSRALPDLERDLMRQYSEHPSNSFYQWGAMAAAQRWRTTRDPRFLDYLRQQARVFTDRLPRLLGPTINTCAQLEGLVAMQGVFVESGDERSDYARSVSALLAQETSKLPRLQIAAGQTQMPLGGEARLIAPRLAQFAGAFLFGTDHPQTRIDNAQHCISALMLIDENERRAAAPAMRAPVRQ
jgi:hypothetical protein